MDTVELLKTELSKIATLLEEIKEKVTADKKNTIELLDNQDLLQIFKISKRTLQSWRDCGMLPYTKLEGKFYYHHADIQNLIRNNYYHHKRS